MSGSFQTTAKKWLQSKSMELPSLHDLASSMKQQSSHHGPKGTALHEDLTLFASQLRQTSGWILLPGSLNCKEGSKHPQHSLHQMGQKCQHGAKVHHVLGCQPEKLSCHFGQLADKRAAKLPSVRKFQRTKTRCQLGCQKQSKPHRPSVWCQIVTNKASSNTIKFQSNWSQTRAPMVGIQAG